MAAATPSERDPAATDPAVTGTAATGTAATGTAADTDTAASIGAAAAGNGAGEPAAGTGPGPIVVGGILLAAGAALLARSVTAAADNGVTLGGPTLAPIIVTGLWVVVAAAYLAGRIRARGPVAEVARMSWHTPVLLLVALVGYSVVLKYTVIGYVLATIVFVLLSARLLSSRPWRAVIVRDLATAVGLSLGIYLVFTRLLGITLPAGVLPL